MNKSISYFNPVYAHQQTTLPKREDCTQNASPSYSAAYIYNGE